MKKILLLAAMAAAVFTAGSCQKEIAYLDGDTKVTITEVKQGSTGNLDIYADFDYAKHDITYVLNAIGVTNHANNPAFSTIGSEEIFLYDLSAVGYVFQGWYSDASLADEYKITHIPAAISAPYTVYAKWDKIVYDITYTGVTAAETPDVAEVISAL